MNWSDGKGESRSQPARLGSDKFDREGGDEIMRKGFGLPELLTAVLIIGALPSVIVPNLVQSQERARRALVKTDMHIVQIALEAWAVDFGKYPDADAAPFSEMADSNPNPAYGSISAYFPGGDPFGNSGLCWPGRIPVNPYTGSVYNNYGGESDMLYGDDYIEVERPGDAWNGEPGSPNFECPYEYDEAPNDISGTIGVCTYRDWNTGTTTEYGIAGYGRDIDQPMFDYMMVSDSLRLVFYILHN